MIGDERVERRTRSLPIPLSAFTASSSHLIDGVRDVQCDGGAGGCLACHAILTRVEKCGRCEGEGEEGEESEDVGWLHFLERGLVDVVCVGWKEGTRGTGGAGGDGLIWWRGDGGLGGTCF